jgi:hypothetical protein
MWISIKAALYVDKKQNTTTFIPVWEMKSDNDEENGCGLRYLGKQYYSSDLHDVFYNTCTKEFKSGVVINYYETPEQSLDVGKEVYVEKSSSFRQLVKTKISKTFTCISSSYMLRYTSDGDKYLFVNSGITPIKNEVYQIIVHETLYNIESHGDNVYKPYQFYTIVEE